MSKKEKEKLKDGNDGMNFLQRAMAKKVLDQRIETLNVKVQEIDNRANALEGLLKKAYGEAADIKEELLKKSCKKLADKTDKKVVTKSASVDEMFRER